MIRAAGRYDWNAYSMDISMYPDPPLSPEYGTLTRQQWRRGQLLDRKEDRQAVAAAKVEARRNRPLRKKGATT